MNLFMLQNLETGEVRDVVLAFGRTEKEARRQLGGVWEDAEQVVCHGPRQLLDPNSLSGCCGE
jgi:hypothetical protein